MELMIVAIIAGVILTTVAALSIRTQEAYTSVREDTDANFSLRRALNRISDDMRQSSSSIIVVTPGTHHDSVDLQVPLSQAGSTVSWGAAGNVGWHIRILVENGQLIRRVVDGGGTLMRTDEVLANNVDSLFGVVKGFSVTNTDGLYQISLRVTAQQKERIWRRTETTSVSTRN